MDYKKLTVAAALMGASMIYAQDAEIATWSGFRKGAVSFTFDDSAPSQVSDAAPMFDGFGYLEGDDLHLEGLIHDPKITVNPSCIWAGSVMELFLAVSPDSPIMQYALVPPYQDQNRDVRSISVTPSPSADDMFYQAELREEGWSFVLIMPLKKRGLDASEFCFDLILRTSSVIKMHPYERKALWGSLMDYANANELIRLSGENG